MAASKIYLRISIPWWAIPYIHCCRVFGMLFGMEPDAEKIAKQIVDRIKVECVENA